MIVFRLEDKNGRGPFNYNADWPSDYTSDGIHSVTGCTVTIIGAKNYSDYRFGCKNITRLRKYWNNELDKWLAAGWVIAKYKVRKNYVQFGTDDIELAFKADKAERIV